MFDGEVSTGAADDLQRATDIAMEMVTRYGMNTTVGQRTYTASPQAFLPGRPAERFNAAELTAREIDVAVRDIIAHAFDRAGDILQARRADLDKGAELLLSKETLTAEDYPPIRPLAGERDSTTDAGSAVAAFKSMT